MDNYHGYENQEGVGCQELAGVCGGIGREMRCRSPLEDQNLFHRITFFIITIN